MQRSKLYIATIPFKNEEQVIEVKKTLEQIFGWVTLRGRNKNRKAVLGKHWLPNRQNDIPWRKAQYIDVYLHHANPNRDSIYEGRGIHRKNTTMRRGKSYPANMGKAGISYYDEYISKQAIKKLYK